VRRKGGGFFATREKNAGGENKGQSQVKKSPIKRERGSRSHRCQEGRNRESTGTEDFRGMKKKGGEPDGANLPAPVVKTTVPKKSNERGKGGSKT